MAELVGSIIGIISAGTKVALVLSQLAADIGSAGQEARMISSEIRTFCTILGTLQEAMGRIQHSEYYAHCSDIIQDMTDASLEMFTEVLDAVEKMKGTVTGKVGKDGRLGIVSKFQWAVFQKPKILVLRAAIEAYKSNIALMLGTLNTVEKVSRRISAPQQADTIAQDAQEQSILQSLELDSRSSLLNLEQVERQLEAGVVQNSEDESNLPIPGPMDTDTEPLSEDLIAETQPWSRELLHLARVEVDSVRSGLSINSSSFNFDSAALLAQVARHSQVLSQAMEDDQKRLSQRWSAVLGPQHLNHLNALSYQSSVEFPSRLSETKVLSSTTSTGRVLQAPQYERFQVWFKDLFPIQQIEILGDIEKEVRRNSRASSEAIISSIKKQMAMQVPGDPYSYSIVLNGVTVGEVPREAMDFLQAIYVVSLSLSKNFLTTFPGGFVQNLRHLNLSHNNFEFIPDQVLQIHSLQSLDMAGNSIQCIPKSISNLRYMRVLDLRGNQIQGVPLEIGNMEDFAVLRLDHNPVIFPSLATRYYYSKGDLSSLEIDYSAKTTDQDVKHTTMIQYELKRYQENTLSYNNAQAIAGKLPRATLDRLLKTSPSASIKPFSPRHHRERSSVRGWPRANPHSGENKELPLPRSPITHELNTTQANTAPATPHLTMPRIESSANLLLPSGMSVRDHRRSRSQGDESGSVNTGVGTISTSYSRRWSYTSDTMGTEKRDDHLSSGSRKQSVSKNDIQISPSPSKDTVQTFIKKMIKGKEVNAKNANANAKELKVKLGPDSVWRVSDDEDASGLGDKPTARLDIPGGSRRK